MEKSIPKLMTSEECEVINRAVAKNCAEKNAAARQKSAMQAAEEKKANQMHCVWQICWTVFAWLVAFCILVIMAHDRWLRMDTAFSLIGCVSMWAGMLIGNLFRRMGE